MIDPRNAEWLLGAEQRQAEQDARRKAAFFAQRGISESDAIRDARARLVQAAEREGFTVKDTLASHD